MTISACVSRPAVGRGRQARHPPYLAFRARLPKIALTTVVTTNPVSVAACLALRSYAEERQLNMRLAASSTRHLALQTVSAGDNHQPRSRSSVTTPFGQSVLWKRILPTPGNMAVSVQRRTAWGPLRAVSAGPAMGAIPASLSIAIGSTASGSAGWSPSPADSLTSSKGGATSSGDGAVCRAH